MDNHSEVRLLGLDRIGKPTLTEFTGDNIPRHANLSHTWRADDGEVTFKDFQGGGASSRPGYMQLRFCGEKAASHGLEHFSVDTCCIDKSSSAKLPKAINFMFRWYLNAS